MTTQIARVRRQPEPTRLNEQQVMAAIAQALADFAVRKAG